MKTSIPPSRAASLLALLLSSLTFVAPAVQAQEATVQTASASAADTSVVDAAIAARVQIAQFRQTLEGLPPIEQRDALRQYIESNFPDGIPAATVNAASINQRLAEQDSKPMAALKLSANATPAQIAYVKARRQLIVAFRAAKRAAFGDNASLTPEQRRDFFRQWQEGQGATLMTQLRQKQQALSQEEQQKLLQRRLALAASASSVLSRIAQTNPARAAALAQRNALIAEAAQITARPDLTTPEQRRDALRQWYETNKTRIDSAREAARALLSTPVQPNDTP